MEHTAEDAQAEPGGFTRVFWDGAVCKAAVCTQGLETSAWLPVEENAAGDLSAL